MQCWDANGASHRGLLLPGAVCSCRQSAGGACSTPRNKTRSASGIDRKCVQVQRYYRMVWFHLSSLHEAIKHLQLSPSSISTCIPSLGCAETGRAEVNPLSSLLCQHLCSSWREGLLLQRMTVVASENPSFGNNRPTTEPSSCFFHPNMCQWQSCSLLLGFLTPVSPPNPKYSCCHGYPSLF